MDKQEKLKLAIQMYDSGVEEFKHAALQQFTESELTVKPSWEDFGEIKGFFVDRDAEILKCEKHFAVEESKNMNSKALKKIYLLENEQLANAFHILFGEDYKRHWTEGDKAAEMLSIFNNSTQPCRPFINWVKCIEFLSLC